MKQGGSARYIIYWLLIIILAEGCKTAEITYLGFIDTHYPAKIKEKNVDSLAGQGKARDTITKKADTVALAVVELLGEKITDFSAVQQSLKTSYFDSSCPVKYEIIVQKISDSSLITVNSAGQGTQLKRSLNGKVPKTIFLQGYVYLGDLRTPSQGNFIILNTIPSKRSVYTDVSGYFEFDKINLSDISLMVFDKYLWSFVEIPLRLKDLSTFNHVKIILTSK